jgi:hypothetical protein
MAGSLLNAPEKDPLIVHHIRHPDMPLIRRFAVEKIDLCAQTNTKDTITT